MSENRAQSSQLLETAGNPNRCTKLSILVQPTEDLLQQGGDERILIQDVSGLTPYGTSCQPDAIDIDFSSSTANTISPHAHSCVHQLLQRLNSQSTNTSPLSLYRTEINRVRDYIVSHWGLPDSSVVLTASGTDAELLALYLSLDIHKDLVNIIIGPDEIGSGILLAASGKHFSTKSPLSATVTKGEPIDGFSCDRVQLVKIALRDESGKAQPLSKIDSQVVSSVQQAIIDGKKVLLHVLDCSKTGLSGPSIETVEKLTKRFQQDIVVVVDACQLRRAPAAIKNYLAKGFLTIITGSKFFSGPPFSGALIIPSTFRQSKDLSYPLPKGLAAYSSHEDWPSEWQSICASLPAVPNFGLLLRWHAALEEMDAFFQIPDQQKLYIVNQFSRQALSILDAQPDLELMDREGLHNAVTHVYSSWDKINTIFAFSLRFIEVNDIAAAKMIYRLLQEDFSTILPAGSSSDDRKVAATKCLIGQPVIFDTYPAVALRVSLSARDITDFFRNGQKNLAQLDSMEKRLERGLEKKLQNLKTVLRKIVLVKENWHCLIGES
jgi:hypothetical protein